MSAFESDVGNIASGVRFVSATAFEVHGERRESDPHMSWGVTVRAGYPAMVAQVAWSIYEAFYRRSDTEIGGLPAPTNDSLLQHAFITGLSKANTSRWSWVDGWQVTGRGNGHCAVRRGEERIVVPQADVDIEDGQQGKVRFPGGSALAQPGWYYARGEEGLPADAHVLRAYWNVCTAGARLLLRSLTRELNAERVQFNVKVLSDPQQYARADAGVLYLSVRQWPRAAPVIAQVHASVGRYLKQATPMFTLPLGPGLAVAESPRDAPGLSFGLHRSLLVAEGLWEAHVNATDAVQAVIDRFRTAGLEPRRPYLSGPPFDRTYQLPQAEPGGASHRILERREHADVRRACACGHGGAGVLAQAVVAGAEE